MPWLFLLVLIELLSHSFQEACLFLRLNLDRCRIFETLIFVTIFSFQFFRIIWTIRFFRGIFRITWTTRFFRGFFWITWTTLFMRGFTRFTRTTRFIRRFTWWLFYNWVGSRFIVIMIIGFIVIIILYELVINHWYSIRANKVLAYSKCLLETLDTKVPISFACQIDQGK